MCTCFSYVDYIRTGYRSLKGTLSLIQKRVLKGKIYCVKEVGKIFKIARKMSEENEGFMTGPEFKYTVLNR